MMKYVVDTSAVIEKAVTRLSSEKKIEGTVLIPNAVIAELENQANKGLEIGFLGLEEIQEIRKLKKIKLEFIGARPNEQQIKFAKSGEIDAFIREIAYKEKAKLITGDKVQAESAKAFGLDVIYLEKKEIKEKLEFEKFFDDKTMSIHLKEDSFCYAKKGKPGEWELTKVNDTRLTSKEIEGMSKEIIEKSRIDPKTFIEISRRGSTIVQCNNYRIVIVRPPVSDGWEITVVKPLKKLRLEEYHLKEKLFERIKEKSRGIIVAGEPGSGKSTFVQALAEFYLKQGKIIKTVESPRDLQVPDEITQYSKNFTSSEEIHDILFLSRPDNIIFDEMRDTPDFELYSDLRLAGAECIGVVHSSSPIDAVQRFISRLEVGMIPSVVDTILFVEKGSIGKVLGLKMVVKVPTGMTESDLARPVVEVRDFENEKLEYEIYSYGEQTVVIPVGETVSKDSVKNLARVAIEREFKKYCKECNVDIVSNNRVVVQVPERDIARIIGKDGKVISQIEKDLGISIEIKELKEEKREINFKIGEDKKVIRFFIEPGREVQVLISGKLLLTAYSSRKGEIKIHKESQVGRKILDALHSGKKIELMS
ncbi:Flp pilus assembly complex ATPase component TadA [Candidatus Woesearchaeota archaeon]|nr:Flp pilus assembly complex ATPase component TadA [Candidatus Woesearchaeota archaeon]